VEKAKPRRQAGLRLPALATRLAIVFARLLAALLLAGFLPALLLLAGLLLIPILPALLLTGLRIVLLLLVRILVLRHCFLLTDEYAPGINAQREIVVP
jgi:hypothetical protein